MAAAPALHHALAPLTAALRAAVARDGAAARTLPALLPHLCLGDGV